MAERTTGRMVRDYVVRVLNGMALGLFASLIIGLIMRQIGVYSGLQFLANFGQIAQFLMGPAIGAGVAFSVGSSPLGVFAAVVTGAIGAGTVVLDAGQAGLTIGEPVGAMLAALAGAEFSRLIQGRTRLDIILVPGGSIIVGGAAGAFLAPAVAAMMTALGAFINALTGLYPLPMGVLVSVTMGMILTLPISSAAIAISLGLSGLAAGAATIGCACQMIGFAVSSFRENGVGGLVSQGLGTSMIQIPNIVRNPRIWIPPTVTAAILGPVGTVIFRMQNNRVGAGMGTSGLVGQVATVETMGPGSIPAILLLHFILPALLALLFSEIMRRKGWIRTGDMALHSTR
ncbi:MAG: PTS sugar transporter subunit IIC [Spirochaetaceae bacterium]|nr:MAG: PTS sugar transporter subunit IIC [Spirochaetaceae bacterium]